MIAGQPYNGLMADIWSSGIVLYAMVCGYLPFEDDDTNILYQKILSGKCELPDFLSRNLKNIIMKILDINPRTRYTIENIRKHPWFSTYPYNLDEQTKGIIIGYNKINVSMFWNID